MPNQPKSAAAQRPAAPDRQNAQADHEGGAHSPDEFQALKPEQQPRVGNTAEPDAGTNPRN